MDVGLPDMDGREACKALRKAGFKSPIILLTGNTSDADVILTGEASLDDAGKFSEAKFTGKLQDFVTEDGGSADYGAGSWGREDWGRERRGRAWGSDRWSDAEERWSGGRSWCQRRDRW